MRPQSASTALTDPWCPINRIQEAVAMAGVITPASSTWSEGANRAVYVPVTFPADCTLYALYARGTNATGNYDLGFYATDMSRIASKGSTAMADALLTLTLPEVRVFAGLTYWAAMVCSSASSGLLRISVTSALRVVIAELSAEASALPLPATMTPVVCSGVILPYIAFGVR